MIQTNLALVKKLLNQNVIKLVEDSERLAKSMLRPTNLTPEKIQNLERNLNQISDAIRLLESYINDPSKLSERVKSIKEMASKGMLDFIGKIQKRIANYQFAETDKQQEIINHMISIYKFDQTVLEAFQGLDTLRSEKIEELKQFYENFDIIEYSRRPPSEYLTRFLSKDSETNNYSLNYENTIQDIENIILVKFRSVLSQAKAEKMRTSQEVLRKFEAGMKFLPENLQQILEDDCKNYKDDLSKEDQDYNRELESVLNSSDLRRIKNSFENCKVKGDYIGIRRLEEAAMKQVLAVQAKVRQRLEMNDFDDLTSELTTLKNYQDQLGDNLPDIKRVITDIQSEVTTKFKSVYDSFSKSFFQSNLSLVNSETTETTLVNFKTLTKYITLNNRLKLRPSFEILPANFEEKIETLHNKLVNTLSGQTRFLESLSKNNISELKGYLDFSSKWDALIDQIRSYALTCNPEDPIMSKFRAVFDDLKSYGEMKKLVSDRLIELKDNFNRTPLINDQTNGFSKPRDDFYIKYNEDLSVLLDAKRLSEHQLTINVATIRQECTAILESKAREILKLAESQLNKLLDHTNIKTDADGFNTAYGNLLAIEKNFRRVSLNILVDCKRIEGVLNDRILAYALSTEKQDDIQKVVDSLKKMKSISNNLPLFQTKINEKIDEVISKFKADNGGAKALPRLGVILNQDSTGVGQNIISEHKAFQGYARSLFNEKTQKHGIDHVIKLITGVDLDKDKLRTRYEEANKAYKREVEANLKPDMNLAPLKASILDLTRNVIQQHENIQWTREMAQNIPTLIGRVFALWTLENAQDYFDAEAVTNQNQYLFQPHAAQIVSILRILGSGDPKEELRNNLVQIGTGEGKSVVLAVVAAILALFGFDVSCACYSAYLSQRDYNSFYKLFESLDIVSHIHYGTFNRMCEGVINKHGDVRKLIENLILNNSNDILQNDNNIKRAKILLVDEVDVFFSKDFYGELYTPATCLKDATITALLDYIWTNRKNSLTLAGLKDTPEYKNCFAKFKDYGFIVEEAAKDMLFDLKSFESHQYIVKEDKIGYKEQDEIAYNVSYGYSTIFAYYLENERLNITPESLAQNKAIRVKCGSFSYAEIPREFKYILGVTGTLKTLSDPEKHVIKTDYNISKETYSPSVFGESNFMFKEATDLFIENNADYHNKITREIQERIHGKMPGTLRAILVFFESKQKLYEYKESPSFAKYKDTATIITEEVTPAEKEMYIKRATNAGQVTLLTRVFGRGTDFVCDDQMVTANGGVHVIQTFFSEELSEEKQIKGRTARQGDSGSYSLVLLDTDLEKFLVTSQDIESMKQGLGLFEKILRTKQTDYAVLNFKRNAIFTTQYQENSKFVAIAKKEHDEAQILFKAVADKNYDIVKKVLKSMNEGAAETTCSKTIVLMDATLSMSHLLHKAKLTVGTMFERAHTVLKENQIQKDCFQIQFIIYRNYDCSAERIIVSSPWETKADNLRSFMDKIHVEGGWGNEAIELGLWEANQVHDKEGISQIILIGDAAPNTKQEVDSKRSSFGERAYWMKTRFQQKTYYENEVQKLKAKGIPVNAFYVAPAAEESFQKIAAETGGQCKKLDINSEDGAAMLTDMVTMQILQNVGSSSGKGALLVDSYKSKFPKSYN